MAEEAIEYYEEEDDNLWLGRFHWMEGDSLAPPCASDTEAVDVIVNMAGATSSDVRTKALLLDKITK